MFLGYGDGPWSLRLLLLTLFCHRSCFDAVIVVVVVVVVIGGGGGGVYDVVVFRC